MDFNGDVSTYWLTRRGTTSGGEGASTRSGPVPFVEGRHWAVSRTSAAGVEAERVASGPDRSAARPSV
jgi:hypothetical protein